MKEIEIMCIDSGIVKMKTVPIIGVAKLDGSMESAPGDKIRAPVQHRAYNSPCGYHRRAAGDLPNMRDSQP